MAINVSELERASKNDEEHHIVICHDPETIKKIKKRYLNVQIIRIDFSLFSSTLEIVQDRFQISKRDKYNTIEARRERIEQIIHTIEGKPNFIRYDIKITDNLYNGDYAKITNWLYQQLITKLNSPWNYLLSCKRVKTQEKQQNDFPLAFEQDFYAVINSPAFRRLQDKTQVFPLETNDYSRTRLTHTIECAAIAEELGVRALEYIKTKKDFLPSCYKIPTILKTAALLHDMGNPPFGHQGEEIIRKWFKEYLAKKEEKLNFGATFLTLHEQLRQYASDKGHQKILTDLFGILGKESFQEWLNSNLEKVATGKEYESFWKTHEEDRNIINLLMRFLPSLGFSDIGKAFFKDFLEKQFSIINSKDGGRQKLAFFKNEEYLCDFKNFEGNAQLLRLVTHLNDIPEGGNRLNLTYATLAVVIKYPTSSKDAHMKKNKKTDVSKKKPGYFTSEKDIFHKIQEEVLKKVGLAGRRHPLTFLLEAADDIAHLCADLQDAHQKGIIPLEYIEKIINDNLNPIQYNTSIEKIKMEQIHAFLRNSLIEAVSEAFKNKYSDIMDGSFDEELLDVCEFKEIIQLIKAKFNNDLYQCDSIYRSQIIAETILTKLLDIFVPAALAYKSGEEEEEENNKRIIRLFSENYKSTCDAALATPGISEAEKFYYKFLLATDFISGMTDSYAQRMFKMLTTETIP